MRVPALLTAVALLLVVGCSDSTSPNGNAVDVKDNSFSPGSVSVAAGTTVTWTWKGSATHNVTWVGGSPAASATQSSGTYQRTFATAGTFEYYCTIHGTPTSGMRGSITVQ